VNAKLLVLLAIVLMLLAGGLALLADGNTDEDDVLSHSSATGTSASVPTPSPHLGRGVVWTEVTPPDTHRAQLGANLLLDTETGKLYSATDVAPEDAESAFAWTVDRLMVGIYERDANTQVWYVGEALGSVKPIPGNTPLISSRGISLSHRGATVVLYDIETQLEVQTIPLPANYSAGSWSSSGKYLTFERYFDYSRKDEPAVLVWDVDQARVVLSLSRAGDVRWAHASDRFVYRVMEVVRGEVVSVESRLTDMQTGHDSAIGSRWIAGWSPDDRYLIGSPLPPQEQEAFSVLDSRDGRVLATLRGAWPMRWIGANTISFIADLCTTGGELYYMSADGTDLHNIRGFTDVMAHPSADGNRVAHTIWGDATSSNLVRLVDLTSGQERVFDVGRTYLSPYPGTSDRVWSPDGRFLVLTSPMGKDGPCMGEHVEPFELIHP
jgi:hypothetical protein